MLAVSGYGADSIGIGVGAAKHTETSFTFFAAEEVDLPITVHSIARCVKLKAQLVQLSSALAAQLDERTLMSCPPAPEPSTSTHTPLAFHFTVPDVTSKTEFSWHFMACDPTCADVADIRFSALPKDLLAPLVTWSKRHRLRIADPVGVLQSFLDDQDIEYSDIGALIAEGDRVVSLIVTDGEDMDTKALRDHLTLGPVVIFQTNHAGLPVILDKVSAHGHLIRVRMPLLDRLSHDASAQHTFFELFQMTQSVGIDK